jgi:hypothetical protein
MRDRKERGVKKPSQFAFSRKPAPKPPFNMKRNRRRLRLRLRKRNSKQKRQKKHIVGKDGDDGKSGPCPWSFHRFFIFHRPSSTCTTQ